jgi:hypothetical protein
VENRDGIFTQFASAGRNRQKPTWEPAENSQRLRPGMGSKA